MSDEVEKAKQIVDEFIECFSGNSIGIYSADKENIVRLTEEALRRQTREALELPEVKKLEEIVTTLHLNTTHTGTSCLVCEALADFTKLKGSL